MQTDISENLTKLKVIISEVDGIITDGTVPYDELGNVPFKNFNLIDLEIINELKKTFKFVFISKYQEINYNFFRRKNIPFYWANKQKADTIKRITERFSVTLDEVLYIGSSYSDFSTLRSIPFSMCPENAVTGIKEHVSIVVTVQPGQGVLCGVFDLLQQEIYRRTYVNKKRD